MTSPVLIVSGRLYVVPGTREAFLSGRADAIRAARAAEGCLDFVLGADPLEPDRVNVHETWTSRAALAAFRGAGPDEATAAGIVRAEVDERWAATAHDAPPPARAPDVAPAAGGCLCGEVRYLATGEPLWVAHCHCHSCRRNTGSAVATFVGYRSGQVRFTAAPRAIHVSSPGVQRGFCARCGTPVSYESERVGDEIHLYLCTLDDPHAFPAGMHVFHDERVRWFDIADALPRHAASSLDAPPDGGTER